MKKNVPNHAIWLKVMRISFIQAMLMAFFASLTYAIDSKAQLLDKRMSVQVENAEVSVVLRKLEKLTNIKFVFSPQVIKSGKKISINFKDESFGNVLEKTLRPLNIKYEVSGKYILLSDASQESINTQTPKNVEAGESPADQTVTGTVTDEKGEGLPGVSILVKGTQRGTTSDPNGKYKVDIPNGRCF